MILVDSHCHLQFPKLAADIDGVIQRAAESGVQKLICVGTTLDDSRQALKIAQAHGNVWGAAGVHPHDAKDFPADGAQQLATIIKQSKIAAIGEIGLDYFKAYSDRASQQAVLHQQLDATIDSGLPYIFHVRDAFDDFWPIFDSYPKLRGIIHSFSATSNELDQILERGLLVGLNGIMTFTKDRAQLAAAKAVPIDNLALETDAPFLTPAVKRGQTCEPAFVRDTAEFLAELRGESLEALAAASTKNVESLLGI